MAHTIPRKAIGTVTSSPSPEPDVTATAQQQITEQAGATTPPVATESSTTSIIPDSSTFDAATIHGDPIQDLATSPEANNTGPIKRKPVDSSKRFSGIGNKRISGVSSTGRTTPLSAGFAPPRAEPLDLRFSLGPGGLCAWYDPTCRTSGATGKQPDGSAISWSAEGLRKKLQIGHEEFRFAIDERVQNVQLLETSPSGLTVILYTDVEGDQQQHCEMPFKSPLSLVGAGKHSYQRCEEAHGNLIPWVTTCSVNGVPLEDIQVAFGPDDAYFAYETVKRKVQSKLIIDLQDCLNSRPDELPAHVSLGVDSAWSVLWADGTHQHYIMPNAFPTLCALMERPDLPRLKRVILSPSKRDEFVIEYENGHYFVRTRMQREDVSKLDMYLKQQNGKTKVIVLGVDSKPLKGDFICRPFVLPVTDFASTPYGELSREGHLAEWNENYSIHDLTNAVSEMSRDAGACMIM